MNQVALVAPSRSASLDDREGLLDRVGRGFLGLDDCRSRPRPTRSWDESGSTCSSSCPTSREGIRRQRIV
jgi:hypothetical protein